MRLVQVAKALGLSGQELRHELTLVNFGVKPAEREIPDTLAKGIIRFIATKKGMTVDVDALFSVETVPEKNGATEATPAPVPGPSAPPPPSLQQHESVHVLRKLTLEDVPRAAIARQEQQMQKLTKAEREERERERKVLAARQLVERGSATAVQEQIKKKEGTVLLPDMISVKEFAEKTGVQVPLVIQTLMRNGVMATITQSIDYETAAIVASELGVTVQRGERRASAEELSSRNFRELLKEEDPSQLEPRPPIVVVMGHVDHGKTALLDAIRQTDVVSEEAGGITQHIGAYQVEHPLRDGTGRRITFLDTPGHEAFTAMRARGAQVTDIVILAVSAEEGVKATTVEAIHHAKEAQVPIIVAITKIDKERADPDRVKGELASEGLQPEEWGGQVSVVLTSAVTKQGIPDLLDHILLLAEVQGYKANPRRAAIATVIESHLDTALGPLATVIVNTGVLRTGDTVVCGRTSGRVKALIDARGGRITTLTPSGAARLSGLDSVPQVGEILQVVPSERAARELIEEMRTVAGGIQKRSFRDLVTRLSEGRVMQLKVVLKADAQGSLEAIQEAFAKQTGGGTVSVKVIHGAVGPVSESDVMMAAASDGVIIAFHAPVGTDVRRTAEREGVKIREYAIIYELLDEVDRLLKGLVEPEEEEKILGHLQIRGVFLTKKSEQIVGGRVLDGVIKRVPFRFLREGKLSGTGRILSLKHVDRDIKEAKEGSECGMRVETTVPIQEGDVLEAFVRELKRKEA